MARHEKKERNKGSAGHNRKSGEDFLEKNSKKDGVFTTNSGLQYLMVEDVSGPKPSDFDTLVFHERALLLNGTLLEDTYRENKPTEVPMNELIEGLQEGFKLMSVGSRYKFWVPAEIAWGKKGTGNKIPPFAVLHFDIRLLEIK